MTEYFGGKTLCLAILWVALLGGLWSVPATAGEAGLVSCGAPGCKYAANLLIGGGRSSPAATGYCGQCRDFKRVKLANWGEYRQAHPCPVCRKTLQPIFSGAAVSQVPCPRCGGNSLTYQRKKLFD